MIWEGGWGAPQKQLSFSGLFRPQCFRIFLNIQQVPQFQHSGAPELGKLGQGEAGAMAAPLFQWIIKNYRIKSSLPACNSSRAILPPPPPPPHTLQKRMRGPCNTYADYSRNKGYAIKMNLYTKYVIYVFKHQN